MRALLCDFTQQIRRSVGRIVIDENGFPAQTSESNCEAIEQGLMLSRSLKVGTTTVSSTLLIASAALPC
jgi:hypothetical protein